MATAPKKAATKKAAVKKSIAKKYIKVSVVGVAYAKKAYRVAFRPDVKQTATLQKVGRTGANNAIRASKALGLPITYMEKGVIVRELSNGVKEIIDIASNPVQKKNAITLKKGMIFHVKK